MKQTLRLVVAFLLASGCADAAQIQPITTTYDFPDYRIEMAFQSGNRGCVLSAAALENKGNRPLNYVYTRLLSVSAEGVTINTIGVTFRPRFKEALRRPYTPIPPFWHLFHAPQFRPS